MPGCRRCCWYTTCDACSRRGRASSRPGWHNGAEARAARCRRGARWPPRRWRPTRRSRRVRCASVPRPAPVGRHDQTRTHGSRCRGGVDVVHRRGPRRAALQVTVQDVANRRTQPAHRRGVGHRPGRQASGLQCPPGRRGLRVPDEVRGRFGHRHQRVRQVQCDERLTTHGEPRRLKLIYTNSNAHGFMLPISAPPCRSNLMVLRSLYSLVSEGNRPWDCHGSKDRSPPQRSEGSSP